MNNDQSPHRSELEIRVKLIRSIWGLSTGMLGISIPLVGVTNNTLIPFAVIVGATVSTAAIWLGKGVGNGSGDSKSALEMQAQLKELEERLANVEAISLLEKRLSERDVTRQVPEARVMGGSDEIGGRGGAREALRG